VNEPQERIVKNNQTFRAANERIKEKSDLYGSPLERIPFLCECPREDCREILRLTVAEYSDVRANSRRYFTVPAHAAADDPVGRVVSREEGYVVVEKDEGAPDR
jgi:hypothetical protein